MRIAASLPLYPTPTAEPGTRVGAWVSTHEALIALAEAGHRVDVVSFMAGARDDYVIDRVRVHAGCNFGTWAAPADVLLSHTGGVVPSRRRLPHPDRGVTQAQRLRKPLVRMAHGASDWTVASGDLVVFNSQALLAEARDAGWDGEHSILHPPIWAAHYATTPGERVTLVNVSAEKGADIFWRLARDLPDIGFLGVLGGYNTQIGPNHVSGKNKDRWDELAPERIAELRVLYPNVEIIEPVTDMAGQVYRRTRLMIMPSERETYGRTAIEAACSGIPTVAAPTPGLIEALGEYNVGGAGLFADRDWYSGWLSIVSHTMTHPAWWERWSQRALERADALTPAADLERFVADMEALAS